MLYYNCYFPVFTVEDNISTSISIPLGVIQIEANWWDNLWHLTLVLNGEKRSCVLYPNVTYFPLDPVYSLLVIADKESIEYTDLSNLHVVVIVNEV